DRRPTSVPASLDHAGRATIRSDDVVFRCAVYDRVRVRKISTWITSSGGTTAVGRKNAAPREPGVGRTRTPSTPAYTRSTAPQVLNDQTAALAQPACLASPTVATMARTPATRSPKAAGTANAGGSAEATTPGIRTLSPMKRRNR